MTKQITDLVSLSKGFKEYLGKVGKKWGILEHTESKQLNSVECIIFWKCVTEGAYSSVSVWIALGVTKCEVCNFKKKTFQYWRSDERMCTFFYMQWLLAGEICTTRDSFSGKYRPLCMTHIGHVFGSSCDIHLFLSFSSQICIFEVLLKY